MRIRETYNTPVSHSEARREVLFIAIGIRVKKSFEILKLKTWRFTDYAEIHPLDKKKLIKRVKAGRVQHILDRIGFQKIQMTLRR